MKVVIKVISRLECAYLWYPLLKVLIYRSNGNHFKKCCCMVSTSEILYKGGTHFQVLIYSNGNHFKKCCSMVSTSEMACIIGIHFQVLIYSNGNHFEKCCCIVSTSEIAYISGIHFQVLIRSPLMILTFSEVKIQLGLRR